MSKPFFVLVDEKSGLPVTTMPSFSLCQDIMSKLPPRHGYQVVRVPVETKKLDAEFVEELAPGEVAEFYETLSVPTTPEDWYPEMITKTQLSDRV